MNGWHRGAARRPPPAARCTHRRHSRHGAAGGASDGRGGTLSTLRVRDGELQTVYLPRLVQGHKHLSATLLGR